MVTVQVAAGPIAHAAEVLPVALVWVVVLAAVAWGLHRRLRALSATARHRARPWLRARHAAAPVQALRKLHTIAAGPFGEACRTVVVTGVAAAIGWGVASGAGLAGPAMAAISATLSVQLSVHSSMKEGTQRIVASLAGLLIAIGVWKFAGVHTWSVAVIAAASLALGRLMRLGDGAIAVPATSLGVLVVGGTMTDDVVFERMIATIAGVVIGAALSPFATGSTALERAQQRLGALSTAIADLLAHIGDGTSRPYTTAEAAGWLSTARSLGDDLAEAGVAVEELGGQARWSLRTPTSAVDPMRATLRVLAHSLDQVASIARALLDAAVSDPGDTRVSGHLAPMLHAAADAFAAHADVLTDSDDPARLAEPIEDLREVRAETVRTLRASAADTGTWLFAGSILTDVDRMVETLDRSAPVLTVDVPAAAGGLPTVAEVIPAMKAARRRTRRVRV